MVHKSKRSLPIELKGNNTKLNIQFVTTMDQYYYDSVGKVMLNSFLDCTPSNFNINIYAENITSTFPKTDRLKLYDWNHCIFLTWNSWKNKTNNKKEIKFGKKGFAFIHALENISADYIVWTDADIFYLQNFDTSLIKYCCSSKYTIGLFSHNYLGEGISAESGFVVVNKKHTKFNLFLETYKNAYNHKPDEIEKWYDGQVCMYAANSVDYFDLSLTKHFVDTHTPINHCPLNQYMLHEKGPTKKRLPPTYFERYL